MSKKTLSWDFIEKPNFKNEFEVKCTLDFLNKLEPWVNEYSRLIKELKEYMHKNQCLHLEACSATIKFVADLSYENPKLITDNKAVTEALAKVGLDIADYKKESAPAKKLRIYRN